jgi:hypothetical protein
VNNIGLWADLDCTTPTACVVAQTGKLSDPSSHLVFPSVGINSNDDIAIVTSAIGTTIYPSVIGWHRAAGDAPGVLQGPATLIAGTQPYTCTANPVSFEGAEGITMVRDPGDQTKLWTTLEYGASATPCVWGTRIFELAP